ncbi:MAG TPA: tripartite tricarboxylate transporter substrate binding protein [Accumulibacter sp.]|uniref:Bug family tripartite tricarboxylate transporter substrate binding protein n=1 Tax=Accumulibacter sp. TaxID=2053492 RepID=UPI002C4BCB5F|nr:tripartite tricarboxylate transporter substrate binding protein [Accumulibacter sp.]HRF71999.1 tripartite tricarboxylate transporter substrate binding protein [Accumulibacter sp.]
MKAVLTTLLLALGLGAVVAPTSAAYPDRAIRLIVPFPAGGPSDSAARTFGNALAKSTGQPTIIENRPGANGAIAAQAAFTASADGYTLLWGVASMVALPLLQKKPAFRSLADLTPVAMIGRFPFAMTVNAGVPANSLAEFIAYARANPDKLSYATSTLGEFMAASEFMKRSGVSMVRVAYKGTAQAMPDLIEGRVQVNFGPVVGGIQYVRSGQLRLLASLLPQRSAVIADVPTMAEAGLPGVSVPTWQAVFAPPALPAEIVDRLARDVARALLDPELRARFERQIFQVDGSTPAALAAAITEDQRRWEEFIVDNRLPKE